MKDFLLSPLLKVILNHKLKKIGHMTTFHIDTTAKSLSVTADLAGESAPIEATMDYAIEERGGTLVLVPRNFKCSREWLSLLAGEMLQNGSFAVEIPHGLPTVAVKALKL
ncbi:hypothetical protein BH09VER1_BH09VER1_52070 [soil metagenome]